MNENKRYTLHQNGNYHTVIDEEENKPLIMIEFKEDEFPVYACFHRIIDLLNEQEKRIEELEEEKESWKSSACHDMNLKSMLSFEIGKLSETKDIDTFLDFYYKHFCKIDGDIND